MRKALVKKTGELLDVKSIRKEVTISIEFPKDLDIDVKEQTYNLKLDNDVYTDGDDGDVELSDGNLYKRKDLIVGLEDIRDYKIKNIIK
jgi:hypothetical protein